MESSQTVPHNRTSEPTREQPHATRSEMPDLKFESVVAEGLYNLASRTMASCDELFLRIIDSDSLTYQSVLQPLGEMDDLMGQTCLYLEAIGYVHPDSEVREAAAESLVWLGKESSSYLYSYDLYKKVSAYARTKEAAKLRREKGIYLDATLDWFDNGGHEQPRSRRKKLKKTNTRLTELENDFLRNIAEDQTVVAFKEEEIQGMDEQSKKAYLVELSNGEYQLELTDSTLNGFLRSTPDRDARRKAYRAYASRAMVANQRLLQKMVYTRQKIAGLLGYDSWIDLANESRIVESPEAIAEILQELIEPVTAQAQCELEVMEEMLRVDGHDGPLQFYDWDYYEARLLKEQYGIDTEKIREYFPLPAVLNSVFELTGKMFGLSYKPIEAQAWHPEVIAFSVDDSQSGDQIGTIYMDLLPREGKYKHCVSAQLSVGRTMPDGTNRLPSSLVVANLSRPSGDEPILLTQEERIDIGYHEFGHVLHDLLTRRRRVPLIGICSEMDFIEIPSKLMENWAWDRDLLTKNAQHYKTGEPMPQHLVDALITSRNLNAGIRYLREISWAQFDLSLHNSLVQEDVATLWERASQISPFPTVEGTFLPAIVDHLASLYAGCYHSYIYDELSSSDMFSSRFEEGTEISKVGEEFRKKMFEPGATKAGKDMILNFLGREPNNRALLHRLGSVAVAES